MMKHAAMQQPAAGTGAVIVDSHVGVTLGRLCQHRVWLSIRTLIPNVRGVMACRGHITHRHNGLRLFPSRVRTVAKNRVGQSAKG